MSPGSLTTFRLPSGSLFCSEDEQAFIEKWGKIFIENRGKYLLKSGGFYDIVFVQDTYGGLLWSI